MSAGARLFGGPAPRLRAIPASAPFLEVLADAMVRELAREDDPFALSDALVLAPNRRAAAGLMEAFAQRLGGAALLPAIRPLGDPHSGDDPDVWGADAPLETIAPPIDAMQRRLELAALIRRRDAAENGVEDPARAIALADELAKLLDSAATVERVAWDKLPSLVTEIELARHWANSARFLEIITSFWPLHLAEQGCADPAAHGAALRSALAARWTQDPPQRPIVVAGSTGSIATTRALMRVVAGLPKGVVVFPGVDGDMDEQSWLCVRDQHPQFALKTTLDALGVARGDIPMLAVETQQGRARRVLMREALAPAERTADWLSRLDAAGGAAFVRAGAEGLRIIEAATEDEEASAIALLLREVLEKEGESAAVITPDAALARRVESKLMRWGVQPVVSHGTPLRECEAGVLLTLLCELARDPGEPVALAALLKHPRVRLGGGALWALEHCALRGPRRHDTLDELEALPDLAPWPEARAIVARVREALSPLTALVQQRTLTLSAFAEALAAAAEACAGGDAWQDRDGPLAAQLLRDAIVHGARLGSMAAHVAPRVMLGLMDGREVAPARGGDARVAIWGPMEARLQRRSLMILAGLNEGVWPAPPGEDPFLSRGMRDRLGLPSLDQRIGLAAHDFAQLANAPNVVLTRALRRDGAPTLASRWLWRLKTLVQGAGAALDEARNHLAWARALDARPEPRATSAPRPRPPAGKRLTRISVTEVETLIRDPYAVYARRILGLNHMQPIGAPPGPAERGRAVHRAIERFEDGADHALLAALLDEEFRRHGVTPERRMAERARLAASVDALIAWFAERRALCAAVYRERKGVLALDGVELSGVADRIEVGDGHAAILDFKTGQPATVNQVESGLSPQLPLEAAMLARGAFPDLPSVRATELGYFRFGGADPTPKPLALKESAHATGEQALAALRGLLGRYAEPDQPFLSKPRVQFVKPYAEYDHLARRKEWADAEGEE
ncbi:MAG: double-strand break repair protein AddB [Hyphomonadaceae bacterium]